MSELTIYKASAGSGKTYQLVARYIKLMVENPLNYKHVLAVTFTNKATSEMKERIVRDLNLVAKGENHTLVLLLMKTTNLPEEKIRLNAKKALSYILHDYDRFAISTIDSFFQRVLRSFTRELGLYGTFEVELDKDIFLAEAYDRVLAEVGTNAAIESWLLEMANQQLNDGKGWHFHSKNTDFAQQFENESYIEYFLGQTSDEDNRGKLRKLKSELSACMAQIKAPIVSAGKQALRIMADLGLQPADFKYGTNGFANYFQYLADFRLDQVWEPKKRVLEACNEIDNWRTKNAAKFDAIGQAFDGGLNQILSEMLHFVEKNRERYFTASLISENIYSLGILSEVVAKMRELGKVKNTILISETNQLLNNLIANNDAPFLYEKTGSFYHYFMIDEFQDTSRTQWANFKPLIINSLAENHENLVVGDVKQSIYRWRHGDWRLLGQQLGADLAAFKVNTIVLNDNWRSAPEIVSFNNRLFETMPTIMQNVFNTKYAEYCDTSQEMNGLQNILTQVYADAVQNSKVTAMNGEVKISRVNGPDDETLSQTDHSIAMMISDMEQLQLKGFQPGDMVILVARNSEGKLISKALAEKQRTNPVDGVAYELISDDSLYLSNSSLVKFVIAMFSYIQQPWNPVWSASAIYEFETFLLPQLVESKNKPCAISIDIQQQLKFEEHSNWSTFFAQSIIDDYFPFVKNEDFKPLLKKWANLNPLSLLSELEKVYGLSKVPSEQANLQALRDTIADFVYRETPALYRFVDWWNENGSKIKLQTGTKRNAIKLMTIHKSKGLEFPLVFIPFCSWDLIRSGNKSDLIWCNTHQSGYQHFPVVPIKMKKEMLLSVFKADYINEVMMGMIDQLNMLYVAFTRAVKGLYVYIPFKETKSTNEIKSVDIMLNQLVEQFDTEGFFTATSDNTLVLGQLTAVSETAVPVDTINLSDYQSRGVGVAGSLRLKKNYEGFWTSADNPISQKINYGQVIHELLSLIETSADIPKAISAMVHQGKISFDEVGIINQRLNKAMSHQLVQAWFDGTCRVLNEQAILTPAGDVWRPDRIMINESEIIVVDYKTSDHPSKKHRTQVLNYVSLLKEMKTEKVRGFVWYINTDQIFDAEQLADW